MWTRLDDLRIEDRIRTLMADGWSLEESVRIVHFDDGIGKLRLCRAVEAVSGLSARETKRLIVRATAAAP